MIDPEEFEALIPEVAALNGFDLDTAGDVVAAVGDCIALDPETGLIVANLPDGRTLKVRWPQGEDDDEEL